MWKYQVKILNFLIRIVVLIKLFYNGRNVSNLMSQNFIDIIL